MRFRTVVVAALSAPLAVACNRASPGGTPESQVTVAALARGEWVLARLYEAPPPMGGGTRPATITFDSGAQRAGGFAGCNRYSAPYTLRGDSLVFGAVMSTKMFCQQGDSLERRYLGMLERVRTFSASDTMLTFFAGGEAVARFGKRE
jgi:heat shock protein HslJ